MFKILLILILVASSTTLPIKFNYVVKAATADYYNLLMEQVKSIGIMEKEDSSSFGVVYVKIADFDKNGSDEFYIVTLPTSSSDYEERLYEGDKLIYENTVSGPGSGLVYDASLSIGEGKKGVYLSHSGSFQRGGEDVGLRYIAYYGNSYSTLKNSQVKKVLSHSTEEFGYDMEIVEEYFEKGQSTDYLDEPSEKVNEIYEKWDGVTSEYEGMEYFINDNEVSKGTYEAEVQPYKNIKWEEIIVGDAGSNISIVDSESIVNQSLNQLEESSKPENLGEDLKDSMEKELKASLVDWLMYSQWFDEGYKVGTEISEQELIEYLYMPTGGYNAIESENYESDPTVDSSFFPEKTFTRMKGEDVDQFLSIYLGQSFPEEDFILDDEYFPFVKQKGYYYFPDFQVGMPIYAVPFIRDVYEIAPDVYYVNFTEYEFLDEEFTNLSNEDLWKTSPSKVFDLITEDERNQLYIYNRGYAVMKKSVIDGEYQWTLIERNTTGGKFDESIIEQYKKQELAPAQIELKLEDSDKYSTVGDYVKMIEKEISSKELNEQDKSLLTQYIIVALQKLNMQPLEASSNTLIITNEHLKSSTSEMQSSEQKFVEGLELEKLSLPKRIERIHRMNVNQLNLTKPVKVQLKEDLLKGIDIEGQGDDSLYISFDGRSMGVAIKYGQLDAILKEYGPVTLIFTYSDNHVEALFEKKNGSIEKLNAPIQIIMPADTETSMVYVDDELWGGQYIEETNSLVFETKGSGTYTIKRNEVNLSDIDKLTDEQQQAITYLVTRGFFDVENNRFEASKTISRNDFAKTLVRLFFSLDKDAQTTFTDVKKDSPYYPFIASGQQNEIIYGYDDNTFKGDNLISISHVLSLSGRTLANKKGYTYPINTEDYLKFLDANSINEEARGEIALTVREGLIDQGGLLEPERQITRLEAAEIMYKLYMLLYEQPLYTVEAEVESAVPFYIEYKWLLVGGGAGVIAVLTGVMFLRRRKLKSESFNM